jgi:hypothetical protein
MITQAIKRWFTKLFEWWPWGKSQEHEYASVRSPYDKGMTQGSAARSSIDVVTPHPGVAPRITGQGETSCSTLDDWQDRMIQPPPMIHSGENIDPLQHPFSSLPATPAPLPASNIPTENLANKSNESMDTPPPTPTTEQHLEFLQYLVQHGLLNEGFAEGQEPDQYRSHR